MTIDILADIPFSVIRDMSSVKINSNIPVVKKIKENSCSITSVKDLVEFFI
jgi:hypothetical protein